MIWEVLKELVCLPWRYVRLYRIPKMVFYSVLNLGSRLYEDHSFIFSKERFIVHMQMPGLETGSNWEDYHMKHIYKDHKEL